MKTLTLLSLIFLSGCASMLHGIGAGLKGAGDGLAHNGAQQQQRLNCTTEYNEYAHESYTHCF